MKSKWLKREAVAFTLIILGACMWPTKPQAGELVYEVVHHFNPSSDIPSSLIQAKEGFFYGTTGSGGQQPWLPLQARFLG